MKWYVEISEEHADHGVFPSRRVTRVTRTPAPVGSSSRVVHQARPTVVGGWIEVVSVRPARPDELASAVKVDGRFMRPERAWAEEMA